MKKELLQDCSSSCHYSLYAEMHQLLSAAKGFYHMFYRSRICAKHLQDHACSPDAESAEI